MFLRLIILLMICNPIFAQDPPVHITLHVRNARIEEVLSSIGKQSGYYFVYDMSSLKGAGKISISLEGVSLKEALEKTLEGQPLTWTQFGKTVVIKARVPAEPKPPAPVNVNGRISNERKEPLPGATISILGAGRGVFAGEDGLFSIEKVRPGDTLRVSCIGYESREIAIRDDAPLDISLHTFASSLDETVIIAYGRTTQRLNTGSVAKVSSREIGLQPVEDPMAALVGRVPGLLITQSSGVAGSYYKVQVRGQNSIQQGSDPLFVIDGVPFAPNNTPLNQLVSAVNPAGNINSGGLSPLALINPGDIESIEILKDADATAIYGSRGAGGVVLITTKKGAPGKAGVSINIYSGIGEVTRTLNLMKTGPYLDMRREAFNEDGVAPTSITAPDLLVWDTTRYTDFTKLLIGGLAPVNDAQASLSAGNDQTQVLLSGNIHRQEDVFPGRLGDLREGLYASVNHHSANKRFSADFMFNLTGDKNTSIAQDLTASVNLAPDFPALKNPEGKLQWQIAGISYTVNPLAYLLDTYSAQTQNLISHLQLSYSLLPGLSLKTSLGYNSVQVTETGIVPVAAQNPLTNPTGFAQFGDKYLSNWIAEPQAEYIGHIGKGRVDLLGGTTWQGLRGISDLTSAYGYTNDALLGSTNGAAGLSTANGGSDYRYEAVFGRGSYNLDNRYLLNLSARRDGSSRFGPGRQFASFGAAGAAWIFTKEPFLRNAGNALSFGKIRASYGTTGNDQIGDYQYLDIWSSTPYPYLGSASLYPTRLPNPYYSWEINRKLETALELGFLHDRILSTTAWYRDRGGNQLIRYGLPTQTGFSGITENFPALVQNSGLEETLITRNVQHRHFQWTTTLDVSLPRNELLSFPGIATSSYSNLEVGKPLSIVDGFVYDGVNPETGVYTFKDLSHDSVVTYPQDYAKNIAHLAPDCYGGMGNSLTLGGWQLDVFFSFRIQTGPNYYYYYYNNGYLPGTMYNQPQPNGPHWREAGENVPIQRYTAGYNAEAYLAGYNLANSSAAYTDASFVRLTNLSLSYSLPASLLKRWGLNQVQLYLRGQNLWTLTRYLGSDPETQNTFVQPPLRILTGGIHCQF